MTSLLTNASAMTALQTLSMTNKNLATTQGRIATGLKVAEASDNAAYWSIATGMRAQNAALGAVRDSLGLGTAVVDTAYTALQEAISKTEAIFEKFVAYDQGGVDTDALDEEITQLQAQVVAIAKNADFEGQNLLKTNGSDLKIITGYIKGENTPEAVENLTLVNTSAVATGAGNVSSTIDGYQGIELTANQTLNFSVGSKNYQVRAGAEGLNSSAIAGSMISQLEKDGITVEIGTNGVMTLTLAAEADGDSVVIGGFTKSSPGGGVQDLTIVAYDLEAEINAVDSAASAEEALTNMRAQAAKLGASKMRLDSQTDFTGKLMDAIDRGVGVLVDADMNAESARLSALQTQQQLGIQALSIANQSSQNILSLFR